MISLFGEIFFENSQKSPTRSFKVAKPTRSIPAIINTKKIMFKPCFKSVLLTHFFTQGSSANPSSEANQNVVRRARNIAVSITAASPPSNNAHAPSVEPIPPGRNDNNPINTDAENVLARCRKSTLTPIEENARKIEVKSRNQITRLEQNTASKVVLRKLCASTF